MAVTDDVLVAEHNPRCFLQILYRSKPLSCLDDCTKVTPHQYCGTCAVATARKIPTNTIPDVDFVRSLSVGKRRLNIMF